MKAKYSVYLIFVKNFLNLSIRKLNNSIKEYMKLLSESLANISNFPDIYLLSHFFFLTAKDLTLAISTLLNSIVIFVFLGSEDSAIFSSIVFKLIFFVLFFFLFFQENLLHRDLLPFFFLNIFFELHMFDLFCQEQKF